VLSSEFAPGTNVNDLKTAIPQERLNVRLTHLVQGYIVQRLRRFRADQPSDERRFLVWFQTADHDISDTAHCINEQESGRDEEAEGTGIRYLNNAVHRDCVVGQPVSHLVFPVGGDNDNWYV